MIFYELPFKGSIHIKCISFNVIFWVFLIFKNFYKYLTEKIKGKIDKKGLIGNKAYIKPKLTRNLNLSFPKINSI